MKSTYTFLNPVKEEDLRLSFGHRQHLSSPLNPSEIFVPTISLFRKMAGAQHFWFIADPINWRIYDAGGSYSTMTPIGADDFIGQPPEILFRYTHPDDNASMLGFSQHWINYYMGLPAEKKAHARATIYLRMLNKENAYNWCMVQYVDTIIDENGRIIFGLTLVTDISHLKKDGNAMMTLLNTYDDSHHQFMCVDGQNLIETKQPMNPFTSREAEVLRLLAKGYSSKQIADSLKIAVKTTDNHRQNMLRKTQTKSTAEMVAYGITAGII